MEAWLQDASWARLSRWARAAAHECAEELHFIFVAAYSSHSCQVHRKVPVVLKMFVDSACLLVLFYGG